MKFKFSLMPSNETLFTLHADAKKRKAYFRVYKAIWILIIALLVTSSILFSLAGLKWNEDDGFPTDASLAIGYTCGGAIVFVLAMLHAIYFGIFILTAFRKTQNEFMQGDKFRGIKRQYEEDNALDGFSKRKLKELKKMKFIDKNQFSQQISLLKTSKKSNKKEKNSM